MAIVTEISWDDMLDGKPLPDSPVRTAWCAAVAEVAAKAKAALPVEVNGHIEQAVQVVLAGEVDLSPDGTATVASQRDGATESFVVNGSCSCPDFVIAPSGWCAHRISAALAKRAYPLAKAKLEATTGAPASTLPPLIAPEQMPPTVAAPMLPEAPASANVHVMLAGRQVQVTLRDTDETCLLARLETLLQRFPMETPVQASATTQTPVCQWHGTMKESTKAQGTWYCSAKMADGSYCKARHPEKGT